MRASLLVPALLACVVAVAGCPDECVTLAQKICDCEPTQGERERCRLDRITNQTSNKTITDDDRAFCRAALDTCDCADIDENRLDQCGFTLGGPIGAEGEGEGEGE